MAIAKKALLRFLIGFNLGMFFNIVISYFCSGASADFLPTGFKACFDNDILALLIYLAVSGLYGGVGIGATVFYDLESWSILRATVSHFVLLFISYFITAVSLNWFSIESVIEWVIMLLIFIVGYFIIWLIMYLIYKSSVKEININLKKLRKSSNELNTDYSPKITD